MPLVDVECEKCGKVSELLLQNGQKPSCPECGTTKVNRRLPVTSIGRGSSSSQPTGCPTNLPPCRPGCCRIN
ncbi:hypothetical protein K2Y11_10270 [bacterium]|nr:hypothetical protein [bacterium]